jgi:hypothetical protein
MAKFELQMALDKIRLNRVAAKFEIGSNLMKAFIALIVVWLVIQVLRFLSLQ